MIFYTKEFMMEERNRFIDPKRYGIWIVVSFGLALLALLTAIMGTHEGRVGAVVTQTEVIKLNERIVALEKKLAAPAVPAAVAPAAQ
jgi:hypothetical protein